MHHEFTTPQNRVYNLRRTLMNKTSWCINSNFLSPHTHFHISASPPLLLKPTAKTDANLYAIYVRKCHYRPCGRSAHVSTNRAFLSENDSFQMTECSKTLSNVERHKRSKFKYLNLCRTRSKSEFEFARERSEQLRSVKWKRS